MSRLPSGRASAKDSVQRSILWPFVYWPLIWILLIHLGTRFMWFLGIK